MTHAEIAPAETTRASVTHAEVAHADVTSTDALRQMSMLIDHILQRFHEPHRRDLPELISQAEALGEPAAAVAQQLRAMNDDLEAHMFKEEMRLFPMIEQGGSSLLGQLVDDMSREHRSHEAEIEYLQQLMSELPVAADQQAYTLAVAALRTGVSKLLEELHAHMVIEDEQLFARFDNLPRTGMP